jgi:hypothetical protein
MARVRGLYDCRLCRALRIHAKVHAALAGRKRKRKRGRCESRNNRRRMDELLLVVNILSHEKGIENREQPLLV